MTQPHTFVLDKVYEKDRKPGDHRVCAVCGLSRTSRLHQSAAPAPTPRAKRKAKAKPPKAPEGKLPVTCPTCSGKGHVLVDQKALLGLLKEG